jgi:Do/DeqQ family serine protease
MKAPVKFIKRQAPILGAAMLGSALTLGAFSLLPIGPQVVTLERAVDSPTAITKSVGLGGTADLVGPDFSSVASKVTPAVVHIRSQYGAPMREERGNRGGGGQDPFGDLFGGPQGPQFFFGEPPRQSQPQESSGSGVIMSADGYIITNNHVIDNAKEIEVILSDNRSYKAKVIGTDPSTDLAVLQIKDSNLPHLAFGNSDATKVGQWVLAVGNPFNLTSTVTAGVVSAKGRNIRIIKDQAALESFIQTDAAVNPGNSGGALVNLNGDLVGINTAITSQTGSFAGYAFAIPSRLAEKVVEDLIKYGVVQRGFLGISIKDLDAKRANELDLDIREGVVVDSINKNSAAEAAGIKKLDVIVKADGKTIKDVAELQETIGRHRPGEKVPVIVVRGGKEVALNVTLKNREGSTETVKPKATSSIDQLGVEFADLDAKELKKLGLAGGVKVKKIKPGIIMKETDMKEGFVITKLDKKTVNNVKELEEALKTKKEGVLVEGQYPDYPGRYFFGFGMP